MKTARLKVDGDFAKMIKMGAVDNDMTILRFTKLAAEHIDLNCKFQVKVGRKSTR